MAIAHIWAEKPDLLILDEPTNHLDFQGPNGGLENFQFTDKIGQKGGGG